MSGVLPGIHRGEASLPKYESAVADVRGDLQDAVVPDGQLKKENKTALEDTGRSPPVKRRKDLKCRKMRTGREGEGGGYIYLARFDYKGS